MYDGTLRVVVDYAKNETMMTLMTLMLCLDDNLNYICSSSILLIVMTMMMSLNAYKNYFLSRKYSIHKY